jgi:hypothetical protein
MSFWNFFTTNTDQNNDSTISFLLREYIKIKKELSELQDKYDDLYSLINNKYDYYNQLFCGLQLMTTKQLKDRTTKRDIVYFSQFTNCKEKYMYSLMLTFVRRFMDQSDEEDFYTFVIYNNELTVSCKDYFKDNYVKDDIMKFYNEYKKLI